MIVHIPSDYVLANSSTDQRANARLTTTFTFAHRDLVELREKKRFNGLTDAETDKYERLREASIDVRFDATVAKQMKEQL